MVNSRRFIEVVTILSCFYAASVSAQQVIPDSSTILRTLDKNHPRLLLKDKDLQHLKEL